jgi:hypothetical protein
MKKAISICGKNQRHDYRGGENIYPKVIEEFLYTMKDKRSLGFGIRTKIWKQYVFGFKRKIRPDSNKKNTVEEKPHYTIGQVKFVTEFP